MQKVTTAAVVVTYNRQKLLVECIEALLNQTSPLDHIFIIDNASADGTEETIRAKGYAARENISYVRLPRNIGGSGGFYEGMKLAYDKGYDWLWLMDDDAEPLPNAFEALQQGYPGQVAVASVVCDAEGRPQTANHRGFMGSIWSDLVEPYAVDAMTDSFAEIDHASFVGVAYSRKVVDSIGFPIREFFIHYDDYEYNIRLMREHKIKLVKDSRILHKEQAQVAMTHAVGFMGKTVSRFEYSKLWLRYYGFRNITWMKFREDPLRAYKENCPLLFKRIIGILL